MKRMGLVAIVVSLLAAGLFNSQPVGAVDNFTITNYDVEMELGRDSEGRSTLRTVETITADFQQRNENRGLERVLVKEYNGHPTNFHLESVTDEDGTALPYHWSGDALRIGEAGVYVFGPQTYRIAYTQRDVARYYGDTGKDEFYWDVIGGEWRVPIEQASVHLVLSPELRARTGTDLYCYTGRYGSTDRCEVSEGDGVYSLRVQNIGEGSGATVALGFAPGTFAAYQPTRAEQLFQLWLFVTAITSVVGAVLIAFLLVRAHRWKYRSGEIGTVVPEYLPPQNASVALSAAVSPGYHSTAAAELTDLAVRHYIQILQTRVKKVFLPAQYDIEVVRDVSTLREEEREVLSDMFGFTPAVGKRLSLKDLQNNSGAYARFLDNDGKLRDLMRTKYGIKQVDPIRRAWFGRMAKISLFFAVVTLAPVLLAAAIVAFILSKTLWVLSDEGLALRRYLKGLEMYIKVAEKDRIKMLQSPDGAEKVGVANPDDPSQLIKLYEKLLPYAILFGHEKEWSKQLGEYYASAGASPEWYAGQAAFNAAAFSSAMTSFSSAVSATSASSGSSSSGGSSGGGFSGGGGGGGGGGGW